MLKGGYILDGKYEVIKTLGQGGMSTVYLCKNIRLGNLWAIKEVKKEMKGQMDFLAEPNILKNLSHHSIPRVVDIFYEEDNLYIVEDYIEGETLQDYIKKNGRIEPERICNIAISICNIIEYLHSFNPPIIYRDLKPSNIMITSKEQTVLIDFGISRVYKQDADKDTIYMGSKGYAAPEQYGIEQTCRQTDIYGLGAVIYFMLVGKAPGSLLEPLKNESYDSEVNIELKKVVQKAMQIDIEGRYSCAEDMKLELFKCSSIEDETKTLLMQYTKDFSKTLIVNCNGNMVNAKEDDNLFENKGARTIFTDKSKIENSYEVVNQKEYYEEENYDTKMNLHEGKISFHKLNSIDSNDEIEDKKVPIKNKNIEVDDEKIQINNTKAENSKDIIKQKIKKLQNKFQIVYRKLKLSKNKGENRFKKKISMILVYVIIVLGLGYLVTDYGKSKQVMKNESTDKAVKNESTIEDKNDVKDVNKDDSTNVTPPTTNTNKNTVDKQNVEKTPISNTIQKNNDIGESKVTDKSPKDKKDNKSKNNGKAKGKHKYD